MDAFFDCFLGPKSQISLYSSLLTANLTGERFALDSVHRHEFTYLPESKDNRQKTSVLYQFPFVDLVAIVVPIPSFSLYWHDPECVASSSSLGHLWAIFVQTSPVTSTIIHYWVVSRSRFLACLTESRFYGQVRRRLSAKPQRNVDSRGRVAHK